MSKFKYLIFPENVYVIDYGEFKAEILGSEILSRVKKEFYLEHLQNSSSLVETGKSVDNTDNSE
jgi:hypothetical protein